MEAVSVSSEIELSDKDCIQDRRTIMIKGTINGNDGRNNQWKWWKEQSMEMMEGTIIGNDGRNNKWKWWKLEMNQYIFTTDQYYSWINTFLQLINIIHESTHG